MRRRGYQAMNRVPEIGELVLLNDKGSTNHHYLWRVAKVCDAARDAFQNDKWHQGIQISPLFSLCGEHIKKSRSRFVHHSQITALSLLDLCQMYARLGEAIRDEKKRLSGE
jgi:hypothetical protein